MERFNLTTWLEDKSRKIVTRDGKQARIICYDVKQGKDDCYVPIIALVDKGEEIGEMSFYYSEDGSFLRNPNQTHNLDLFFADEEELTEFEKAMQEYYFPEIDDFDLKRFAKGILDLARKELEKENPYNGKQKQDWSEEDEKLYTSALWHIKNSCGNGGKDSGEYEVYNWLKSIKDRVQPQPKQEWSQEDTKRIQRIHDFIWKNRKGDTDEIFQQEQDANWLMTFVPQPKQELTEEDKEVLNTIISDVTRTYRSCGIGTDEYNIRTKALDFLKSIKDKTASQPQQEWSEENEERLNQIADYLKYKGYEDDSIWLKSLKDRFQLQPKQEWSEYDTIQLEEAIQMIEANGTWIRSEDAVKKVSNWLKSLKDKALPQTNQYDKGYEDGYSAAKYNQWKPTDKQMEDFQMLLDYNIGVFDYTKFMSVNSLYEDLKKNLID